MPSIITKKPFLPYQANFIPELKTANQENKQKMNKRLTEGTYGSDVNNYFIQESNVLNMKV